ncbi:MAG: hypothetical protein EOP09_17360, partial [Proteobacteria bacterium]
MKTLIKALGFVSLLSAAPLMAVDTTRATQADASLENGLEKVKAGTQEAAKGVTAAAEEASKNAAEVGKKMGRSIIAVSRFTALFLCGIGTSFSITLTHLCRAFTTTYIKTSKLLG